jgi:DNA-binding transcriptional LysR family regulator
MNWDDLRVFLALSRAGTLMATARSTGLDATTVARRIARLEKAIGLTLFEHTSAGQVLTESGQEILAFAETMEAGADRVRAQAEPGPAMAGTIRVSASEGFGTWFIGARLHRFTAAYPKIAVELIASTGFLNPSRREADLALMLARPRSGPLVASKLTDYRLGIYAAAREASDLRLQSIDELVEQRLIGYIPELIYAPELHYLAEIDRRLSASLRSSSITAQARMIAGGAGIGILPCFLADAFGGLVRLMSREVAITRSFWLVVHRDTRRLARVDAFTTWLREEVAQAQPSLLGTGGEQ